MTMVSIAQSHLDRVLLMVDTPGRYHFLIAFLLCCMQFPVSFSGHLLTFYTATPKHRCRAESNLTFGDYDLRPIITVNGRRQYSACELYSDPRDHSKGTKACDDGWEFQVRNGESTVVTEWELVCEYEALAALLPYLATVAAMIGALATGILADKYGRKYVLVLSLLFHTSFGVFLHFLPLFGIFATVFSLQAFLIAGVQCTSYLLLIENLPTTWHSKAALAVAIFHCLGELILATLAWLIRHWRYLQLIISAPGVVVFGYFWLLPRSLAWLVVENRQHSAQIQLARFTNEPTSSLLPSLRMQILKSCRVAVSTPCGYAARHSYETIICSSRLRTFAFTQYYIWFVVSLVSKCTAEEIPALRDNPYSRLFVHGVLELSFVILIHLASTSVGLKLTQATSLSISGICCMFAAIVNHQIVQMRFRFVTERGLHHFAPVFALLGKSIANASFLTLYMYAIKTFPTGVRGLGLSSCMFWGEVAHLFVPHFDTLHSHSRFQILAIAGALSFVAGILTSWLLPDCTDRPLATIAEEVEIGQTKIINDSDLDFRDTSIASGFVPNIPAEDPETSVRSNNSVNEFEKLNFGKGFLRRLAFLIRCKTQRLFSPSKYSTAQMSYGKEIPPISVVGGDIFEPVTGFIFKWDQAEPTVKISDFEKEMSVYWKPNCDPNEKKLNDKHLNSLNILYNIQSNALDGSNECVELQNSSEDITDSSL
ncbi:solute carrier family 22 member 8-like isoform X1 [Stegodyphus dumicola]|uniref:solute carrier family 22 member 8-like isoform X1 n=1 Tax=Stegodyphus dumicola TaxID=202533 RepID=UPI0015B27E9E|nr:solute carrier family 22 member 8-like isoform X1 [Stegodyphus dumicola]